MESNLLAYDQTAECEHSPRVEQVLNLIWAVTLILVGHYLVKRTMPKESHRDAYVSTKT